MVEMSGEQRFQFVLGGSASQRNESDHIATAATIPVTIFPVLIPDETGEMHPETGHLSLEAKSSGGEQPAVKRKRGRPRKIKPEEQNQGDKMDASLPDQQPAAAVMKRGRPKRSEQTTKRELEPAGEASMPVKRGRGRPKKVATSTETSQSQVLGLQQQPRGAAVVSNEGITSHASTDIFNAVQQLAQDAVIVSAIHGTPVQVLPTTAVATMNTIDGDSTLRISAPISVAISPTRDDATEWTASAVRITPPSRSTDEKASLEKRTFGTPLVYQVGATTPPLLHAEQPEVLNLLPQCNLSSGEVSVKIVDRLAGLKERDGRTTMEQVHHDTCYLKQPEEGVIVVKRQETKVGNTAGNSLVSVSGEQGTETQEQLAEVKTQLEQPPVKRKRGRPPKNRNTSQPSTTIQEEPSKKDIDSSSTPSGDILDKPAPSVEASVTAADPPVVKRKLGRLPKVKTQNVPSESPVIPPQVTTITTTTTSVSGEENKKPRKRGRPPKSIKSQVQMTEASGEVKVKRGRGRPRKYPIPAVAASGPFLPSVSGVTLPAASQNEEQAPTQGIAPPPQIKSLCQGEEERSQESQATATVGTPVNRKRGRPPKNPDGPPPAKRKPGRPRIHPSPDLTPQKRGRPRKNPEPTDLSPRKRGRPRTNPSPDPSPRKRGRPKRNPTPDLSPKKRGRPRKHPLPGEETAPPKKPGRPRKNPVPDEKEHDSPQNQREQQAEQEKEDRQASPEIIQKETSPIIDVEETTEPLPKRKRGRPRKIPPVAPPPQEPTLSSSADESTASLTLSGPEKAEDDDSSSTEVMKLSLQISFSDSDSEHSEKVESNAIMALADRVVAPSPSPPRQLDSPLLNPSFEESYDEDSDPDSK